jgi:hypothetical protein
MSDEAGGLTIEEWLGREMGKMLEELMVMEIAYETHQEIWGVPCGPTLSMVNPPQLLGIQHDETPYTAEQEAAMWGRVSDNLAFMETEEDKNGNKIYRY